MRKLLIKLVAIETMLVGWLSYWIFLIYANNPAVSAGLGDQLSKFPQIAFTTVDLAVLVIIAAFAVTLAFKFHRGLRPGIRLERALQMLENLMKRNLVLEAQVAELRVEKVEKPPSKPLLSSSSIPIPGLRGPGLASLSATPGPEPQQGSWEKAFRTPLEAGLPATKVPSSELSEPPFHRRAKSPAGRTEEIPPIVRPAAPVIVSEKISTLPGLQIEDKPPDKPTPSTTSTSSSANWEESPKFIGETMGILTPSSPPKKGTQSSPELSGLSQPYIPVPAPRMTPPSIIVGPMNQKPSSPTRQTPKPIVRPTFSMKSPAKEPLPPSPPIEVKPPTPPIIIDKIEPQTNLNPPEPPRLTVSTGEEETKEKASDKTPLGPKKKFPDEEN